MANVFIEENTMTAIGEAIRTKTGKTDLILPANMPEEILSIQTGGGGGVGSPLIVDGFTVYFYDTDNKVVGVGFAEYGRGVGEPLGYTAESWKNEDGLIVDFPFVVDSGAGSEVINLYASGAKSCVTMIQDHYADIKDVKDSYPYIFIYTQTTFNGSQMTNVGQPVVVLGSIFTTMDNSGRARILNGNTARVADNHASVIDTTKPYTTLRIVNDIVNDSTVSSTRTAFSYLEFPDGSDFTVITNNQSIKDFLSNYSNITVLDLEIEFSEV